MSFGSSDWQGWVLNEKDTFPLLEYAYDKGINTWDTVCTSESARTQISVSQQIILSSIANTILRQADIYSHGRSEEIIGKFLEEKKIPRDRVVIMTKCYFGVDDQGGQPPNRATIYNDGKEWVNRVGLSRKHIFDAVEASVRRLKTHIDVLQIHRLDRETPRKEIMKALNDVVDSGKVRYIGASSVGNPFLRICPPMCTNVYSLISDGSMGVPDITEHSCAERMAPIHFYAKSP
jgi:aryl-alcohol dehydrogenase-like predicted oxidoreductase